MNGEPSASAQELTTRCCIAGGGPAGMMAGFLLARAGVDVVVLEKHGDFLRDFRGDTVHPSTLEVMHELGLLAEFLQRPHQEMRQLSAQIGATTMRVGDFSRVPTHCKFIAFMPQWEFLNFLAEHAARYKTFHLHMRTQATDLIEADGRVTGVRAQGPDGALAIRADLVIAADGRHSTLRQCAGFKVEDIGAPMDVLWLRLPRAADEPGEALGYVGAGLFLVLINRGDYWQCGYVIRKGGFDELRRDGLPAFRAAIVALVPRLSEAVETIRDWDDVKLLTVAVDRLSQWWRAGLLCIGDAAHAMSPVGGVGINLAVQDAVAAANILAQPLRAGALTLDHLRAVQRRRALPTRTTQAVRVLIQKQVIERVLGGSAQPRPPLPLRLVNHLPFLQHLAARAVGLGVRPEHVATPEILD